MPKGQSLGILGVKRPDRPLLFSFQPKHEGGEWPSDDSDSDFVPTDDEPGDPETQDMASEVKDLIDGSSSFLKGPSKHKKKKSKKGKHKKKKRSKEMDRCDGKTEHKSGRTMDDKKNKKDKKEKSKRTSSSDGGDGEKKRRRFVNKTESSSEESDYTPSDEEGERKLKEAKGSKKNKLARRDGNHGNKRTLDEEERNQGGGDDTGDDGMWDVRIPLIALEKIFSFVIKKCGAVPTLNRLSRVCRLWRHAADQPMLWQYIDLANGRVKMKDNTVQQLADSGRLAQLREISFSGWKKLTDKGLEPLLEHCPHLERIDLTLCVALSSADRLKMLAEKCSKLKALDLSMLPDKITVGLSDLLEVLGDRLEHLTLTHSMFRSSMLRTKGRTNVIKSITTHCTRLKTLDLSNSQFSTEFLMLPIEELQVGCPHLQTLRLAGCRVRATQASSKAKAESSGFPCLTELSLAVSTETTMNMGVGIDDQFLLRILKNASNLKMLDLRGLTAISAKVIENISAENLEQLYISKCSLSMYVGVELVVQKWRHSLIDLDLSWNVFPGMSLDIAMSKLSSSPTGQSVLQDLNLSGTAITDDRVRSILQGCPNLINLNLTSCRGLPRGMKRTYGQDDLQQLAEQLGVKMKK